MRHISRKVSILVALVLLASLLSLQTVSAGRGTVRIGKVSNPDPSGPLFTESFDRHEWASIEDGKMGDGNIIVVEVFDTDPIANSTGPGGTNGIDTVEVIVTSDSDDTGLDGLTLQETNATSGLFRGTFQLDSDSTSDRNLNDPTDEDRPTLEVDEGDEIEVRYRDGNPSTSAIADLEIEIVPPEISSLLPQHNSFQTDDTVNLSVRVVDDVSGIEEDEVFFLISDKQFDDDNIFDRRTDEPIPLNELIDDNPRIRLFAPSDTSEIEDDDGEKIGLIAETEITVVDIGGFGEVYVTAAALDRAGNLAIYDVDVSDDEVVFAKYTVDSEPPELYQARTGVYFDNVSKRLRINKLDSIQVIFEDSTDLDPSSIQTSDFLVAGHTVVAAEWFDRDPIDEDVDGTDLDSEDPRTFVRRMVFLTLQEPLEPNERPNVSVVFDGVTDRAGNVQRRAEERSRDFITAQLTLESMSTSLAGKDTRVEFVVTVDDDLGGDRKPEFTITNAFNRLQTLNASVEASGGREWKVTANVPTTETLYSMFVGARDADERFISLGIEPLDRLPTGSPDGVLDGFFDDLGDVSTDAIYFEADLRLPKPNVTPPSGGEITKGQTNSITVDFGSVAPGQTVHEGNEYRGDAHARATLTLATLDGADVLPQATSADGITWLIPLEDISIGSHQLVINAVDEAGNTLDEDYAIDFEVIAGNRFTLNLDAGWNLVSFPRALSNASISSVIPSDSSVTAIYSFSSTVPGEWQVAARDDTSSPFRGDLKAIQQERGYWIQSDAAEEIAVELIDAGEEGSGVSPQIDISPGWNLIPVIDFIGALQAGDVIDADVYFSGLEDEIASIFDYDNITEQWEIVVRDGISESGSQEQLTQAGVAGACPTCPLDENERVIVGKAYWVFASEQGILVP